MKQIQVLAVNLSYGMYALDAGESIYTTCWLLELPESTVGLCPLSCPSPRWWPQAIQGLLSLGFWSPLESSVSFKGLPPCVIPMSSACLSHGAPTLVCSAASLIGLWSGGLGAACFLHSTCWPAMWEDTQTQQQDGIFICIILEHPRPHKHVLYPNPSD